MYLDDTAEKYITGLLLDRFLACMKPASITIRLPRAGVFFINLIKFLKKFIEIFLYIIGL